MVALSYYKGIKLDNNYTLQTDSSSPLQNLPFHKFTSAIIPFNRVWSSYTSVDGVLLARRVSFFFTCALILINQVAELVFWNEAC